MYERLGQFVARRWWLVILAWIAALALVRSAAPPWDSVTNDGDLAYLPARMTSVRGDALLRQAFPNQTAKSQIVIVVARDDAPLGGPDLGVMDEIAARFAPAVRRVGAEVGESPARRVARPATAGRGETAELPVLDVWTPRTEVVGRKLLSRDRHAALVLVFLGNEFMAVGNMRVLDEVERQLAEVRAQDGFPAGLELGVSGSAAIGGDMLSSARESIDNTELTTVALVMAILLVVYRAPLLVAVPLITIAVSAAVALGLVALLTQVHLLPHMEWVDFKIFKTTKIFIFVILFGAGTDFCLFLIARYREELKRGLDKQQAAATALANVSDALLGSALTTIFGLGMMYFADFGKFRNSGPAIALCLFVALVACMTLAPALLRLFGMSVFWPFARRMLAEDENADDLTAATSGAWGRIARMILARPALVLFATLLALSPLAYVGLSVPISYDLLAELEADRPSVRGTQLLRRHFPAGETGPIGVLVYQPGGRFNTPDGEQRISQLTADLYEIEGVAAVRSLTEPLGDKPGFFNPFRGAGQRKLAVRKHPRTIAMYLTQVPALAGEVTRLDVVSEFDPFSSDAAALLARIDEKLLALSRDAESPWRGAEFDFVGATAATRDLQAVTESDQQLIQRLVVLAVFAILLVVLRRPLVSAYLIASVLFTYFVTIGATELVFRWLYPGFEGLDWKVPLFLFVILIAVGQDYNIYLVTRVFEEQRRFGLRDGLCAAVAKTGGIITSCGVIMAGTFLSMMTGTLRGMLELGFALSLGVLLDTMIIRPIVVPAIMALSIRWTERREQRRAAPLDGPTADAPIPTRRTADTAKGAAR